MPPRRQPRRRPWGGGSIERRGPAWRIVWRENGRRQQASFPTLDLAERALARIQGDLAAGRAGVAPDPTLVPTLGELAETWLAARRKTHRSAKDDESRWRNHLAPAFAALRPAEVDAAAIRRFVQDRLARGRLGQRGKDRGAQEGGLSPATVRLCVRQLSTFFTDLVDEGRVARNPCIGLPKKIRASIRPTYDTKTTPFLELLADVRRVFLALPEPYNVAFAVGALLGLRTGEVQALRWSDVDLQRGRVHVQVTATESGRLKDGESRIVPIQDDLLPVLVAWRARSTGTGNVIPAGVAGRRRESGQRHVTGQVLGRRLRAALEELGLPSLTWYQATRHTFASHWALAGGEMRELQTILGHSTVAVTERYAHLRPGVFSSEAARRIRVSLDPADDPLSDPVQTSPE